MYTYTGLFIKCIFISVREHSNIAKEGRDPVAHIDLVIHILNLHE